MNQIYETLIKAALIVASYFVGSEIIKFDETTVALIAAGIAAAVAIIVDAVSTYKLRKQGVVSTDPAVNVATGMTPRKLVAEEKKAAK